jgi:outer membrane protein assembly factor BamB
MDPPYTGAAAARKAGYSPKSARFIASRLWKKPIIREIHRRKVEIINKTIHLSDGTYYIPDYSGKYHIYRNKKI